MYRIEIFDQSMDYVSACYTDDAQTISLDYLAFDPFQINIQNVAVKKGYFCHITKDNVTVADCIVSDVKPGKELQEISLRPLQALFDAEVFYNAVTDAITWIGNNLTAQYINSTDTYQLRPLVITTTPGSRAFPLTGYNLNPTMNILSVITNAFRTWGVVTEASLDLVNKQILVNVYEQTATKTIECDLENVISSEVTLGDSYGSTNKLIVKKTVAEGSPTGTTEITYYRHNDGCISTTDTDRIVPVFWDVETLEQTEDMTDADWIAETETMAKETLTPAKYDNEVVISVWEDDKIVNPKDIALGTITTLYIKGTTYYSILTGETIEGNVYTLTFGAVRTELTKKLAIQSRSNGTSSGGSSGGGGGGGGGDVTGVKGNAETVYRVGDVNITPANIGLGNVDNTSDADKPISTATQTALNNKVDKVTGKGLSTNDYTTADKTKLAGIEEGAQVNKVTGVKGSAESSYRVGNVNITKANIGLGNVDNTSDANKPISTATQTALNGKVSKSGDTMTGTLVVPVVQTGSTDANYFQTRKMRGEGSASTYYHAIDFGYAGHNQVDFYEYGGLWNFYKNTTADGSGKVLVGKISANGWEGNVVGDVTGTASQATTASKATADGSGNNIVDTYATKTALDNKVDKVTGKGLSTNDFTTAEKNKLSGIESGAQVNTITGVKGNAESSYRTGNVNLTPANIGAVPTSRTVNGHALSANVTVTASDVGLGNVNNTSDLNKPISTATQSALNAKVNKTDIATTSDLGLVKPDGSTITIEADGTIHSVGGGGGGGSSSPSRVLLWTNPSTSTPFPAQNVLSASQISAYTSFEIEVRNYIAENIYNICKITKDSPRQVWAFDTSTMGANSGVPAITNRQVRIDSNGLSFEIGYSKTTTNSGRAGSTPDVCIPCRIWGIVDSGGTSSITYFESQTTSVASNAEILRITDSSITTNTVVLECTFANPSAISGDVSWTSYNGYISFTGTCTSATTANVTLADKTN